MVQVVGAPFYWTFYQGPKNAKKAYVEEVWELEKEEQRGKWRNRLIKAPPRMIGEEAKAIVDGITGSVDAAGEALKEFISIFCSD
ncbi:MAG: hypothetical protein JW937_00610 [Candidatus Omnitrophica bacterium]|nr:hypothetical protein [Candidatus Omnitrophota bacterium]